MGIFHEEQLFEEKQKEIFIAEAALLCSEGGLPRECISQVAETGHFCMILSHLCEPGFSSILIFMASYRPRERSKGFS